MGRPWNNWYHCMGNTYGTWLYGDPRGFRTRHHREHIPYDYKNPPPPDLYREKYERSKRLMPRPSVFLSPEQRRFAVEFFVASLQKNQIELIVLAIDRIHFHLLARFPDHDPRRWLGIAKKESSHYMKDHSGPTGGIWGTRTQCVPINDRAHQVAVADYILAHAREGAAVWRIPRRDDPARWPATETSRGTSWVDGPP